MTATLSTYREAFERALPDLPGDTARRRRHFDRFLASGFPGTREEAWRYTDLSSLATADYASGDAVAAAAVETPELAGCERRLFVNGKAAGSDRPDAIEIPDDTDGPVTALNAALASDGLRLALPRDARPETPLHVVIARQPGAGRGMSHLRHRIRLAENAEATVILHGCGTGDYFATDVVDVDLAPGARLRLYRVADDSAGSTTLSRIDGRVDRNARLDVVSAVFSEGLAREDINVQLMGEGADVALNVFHAGDGHAHLDTHSRIEHRVPHGRSRERFRGVFGQRAHGVFDGLIVVSPGAVKTDSDQHVATLLLSPRAEINAKPELEIYNDDVRCSHGATTGQLDETALFYLRSRGLARLTAASLLTRAFAISALEAVAVPALSDWLDRRLDRKLRALMTRETSA